MNDFSGDGDCLVLYRFEAGALETDSSGNGVDLTGYNDPAADTTHYQEGAASVVLARASSQAFYVADPDLPATFPGKDGAGTQDFSITAWVRPDYSATPMYICTKDNAYWATRGWRLFLGLNYNPQCDILLSPLGSMHLIWQGLGVYPASGQWYFIAVSVKSTGNLIEAFLHVWDDVENQPLGGVDDATDTDDSVNAIASTARPFTIGAIGGNPILGYNYFNGNIDELTVWDRALTRAEIDQIRQGIYGSSSSSSSRSSSFSSESSHSSSSSQSSSSSFVPLDWPMLSRDYDLEIEELPADREIAARMGCGRDKVRARFTRQRRRWRLRIRYLTLADFLTLERFHLVDCRRSVKTFTFTHPKLDQQWLVRFDPAAPPHSQTEARLPEKYAWEATFLEDTAGAYGPGAYGHLYYPSG